MNLPNYTQVSNEFIENMHQFSGAAVKIFLAISRKTIGWHKISDRISYTQLEALTGLSTNSIKKGIAELDGWITQHKTKNGYEYDLNFDSPGSEGVSKNDRVEAKRVSKNDTTKETINIKTEYKEMARSALTPMRDTLSDKIQTAFADLSPPEAWGNIPKERKNINTLAQRVVALCDRTPQYDNCEKLFVDIFNAFLMLKEGNKSEYWRGAPITPSALCARWSECIDFLVRAWDNEQTINDVINDELAEIPF